MSSTDPPNTTGVILQDVKAGGNISIGNVTVNNIVQPATRPLPFQKPPRPEHFTGREAELAQLLADLQPGRRVTLSGPGGMGKTALASEALWTLAPGDALPARFPDGMLWHSFDGQPQAGVALEALARAYGEELRPNPAEAARRALAGRRALVVLDGAEAADDLEAVLAVTGSCGVLITTRRHADAPAGWLDVAPLPPDEAVRLLQAWGGDGAADRVAAGRIATLLGGLPLALFLCGRYLAQHRQRAVDYLPWLEVTPLAALHFGERQSRSIPLLLAGSLEQVSAGARAALGVAGLLAPAPFDREAVAAALEIRPNEADRELGELVDYGLLLRPDEGYLITHALEQAYARQELAPPAEALARLAVHYVALAMTQSKLGLAGYNVLDRQRRHILAVQAACGAAGQWDAVRQITWSVEDYLDLQGYSTERKNLLDLGLAGARNLGDRYDEGAFLGLLGLVYAALGEVRRAIDYHEQALAIKREIGDRRGEGTHLGNLGLAYAALGEMRRAIDYHEQALAISREIGDRRGEGADLGNLGSAFADLGEVRRAIEYYEQALAISREIGDRRGEGADLGNLGIAYKNLGEVRRAIDYHEQALTVSREIGDRRGEGTDLGNLGLAYADSGDVRRAIDYHEQALAVSREIGDRRGEGTDLGNLGSAYYRLGEVRRAIDYHEQALAISRATGDRRGEGNHLGNLGLAYAALGELRRAIEYFQQALAIKREIGDRRGEGDWLGNLGSAYAALGEVRRAIEYHEQALAIKREIGDRRGEGAHLGNLGSAFAALGEVRRAIEYDEQALAISREIGDRRGEGADLGNLGSAYADLGEVRRAIDYYEQGLVISREIGDRSGEGNHAWNLGLAYEKEGRYGEAAGLMQIAVDFEREIGHPDAERDAKYLEQVRLRAEEQRSQGDDSRE